MTIDQDSTRNFPKMPVLLYVGDILMFILFTLMGRESHSMATGADAVWETLKTAMPFILGWLVIAPWLGAYGPRAWRSTRSAATTTLIAFIPSIIFGILLRALFLERFSPLVFYAVTVAVLLPILLIWRLLYARFMAPRLHHQHHTE